MMEMSPTPEDKTESKHWGLCFSSFLPLNKKQQPGGNGRLRFLRSVTVHDLMNLMSWRLPVCRIQPRWSIQS